MIILELNDVEIDYCTVCKGIWLDAGELEILLEDGKEKDYLLASMQKDLHSREKKIKCPICHKKMDKVFFANSRQPTLDQCKNKHGIWFDQNELEDLLRKGGVASDHKIMVFLANIFYNKQMKGEI